MYFLIHRHRNYYLGLFHLLLTTPLFLQIIFNNYLFLNVAPRRYIANGDIDEPFGTVFPNSFYIILILFVLGQILFLTNVVISIIKTINLRTHN